MRFISFPEEFTEPTIREPQHKVTRPHRARDSTFMVYALSIEATDKAGNRHQKAVSKFAQRRPFVPQKCIYVGHIYKMDFECRMLILIALLVLVCGLVDYSREARL